MLHSMERGGVALEITCRVGGGRVARNQSGHQNNGPEIMPNGERQRRTAAEVEVRVDIGMETVVRVGTGMGVPNIQVGSRWVRGWE